MVKCVTIVIHNAISPLCFCFFCSTTLYHIRSHIALFFALISNFNPLFFALLCRFQDFFTCFLEKLKNFIGLTFLIKYDIITKIYMSPYLSWIEGPPPKRNAGSSNLPGDANREQALQLALEFFIH